MNQRRIDEIRVRVEADRVLGSYDDRDKDSWMNAAAMDREWLLSEVERLTAELAAMTARAEALEATTRSRDTRPCHWPVRIGDTFNGRKIVGADYGAQTITIDWRGPVEKGVSTDAD